jgi:hypothetical protein
MEFTGQLSNVSREVFGLENGLPERDVVERATDPTIPGAN